MTRHVAIDIGTSGGKMFLGAVNGGELLVREVHRFESGQFADVDVGSWNIDFLVDEIVSGLATVENDFGHIDSIGIDTTAGVFGFLKSGELLGNPIHRRGSIPDHVSPEEAFFETGHQRLPGAYYSLYRENPELVDRADKLLLLPGLLAYRLGGEPCGELTYAISAGMGNARTRTWAVDLMESFGLPVNLLPEMVPIGSRIGTVDSSLSQDLESSPEIVVVPGHDTSCAVAAIPFEGESRTFISTGSWFIPGLEVDEPIVNQGAFEIPAENVGGVEGTARFVRNIPGFSLLEHCRVAWREAGGTYEYDELLGAVAETPAFGPLIDTGDELFIEGHEEGGIEDRIETFCQETGQEPPRGEGAVARCLLESLAAESAVIIDQLLTVAESDADRLHVVGGGVRNAPLCEMIASASGLPIEGGPIEATAIGNVLVQLQSYDEIDSICEGRQLVREATEFERYEPREPDRWTDTLSRMRALII